MHNIVALDRLREDLDGNTCTKQFKQVAKKLVFHGQGNNDADFTFTCSTPHMKKTCGKLSRKQDSPLVDTFVRRNTRITALNDGYKHKSLPDTRATPCKKRIVQKKYDQVGEQPSKEISQRRKSGRFSRRKEQTLTRNVMSLQPPFL
jgi:hypothetical protein